MLLRDTTPKVGMREIEREAKDCIIYDVIRRYR